MSASYWQRFLHRVFHKPKRKFALRVTALLIAVTAPVHAATALNCEALSARISATQTVEACSALILSGQSSGEELAYYYYSRGDAYLFRGTAARYPKLGDLDRVIESQADFNRALADYTKAIEISPSDNAAMGAYSNRAILFALKGDFGRAIEDLDKAIGIADRNKSLWGAPSYQGRGLVYEKKGDLDRAIADYTYAIGLYKHPETDFAASSVLEDRCRARLVRNRDVNDLRDALADCNAAIMGNKVFPEFPLNLRGVAYFKLGEFDKAINDFTASASKAKQPYAASLYARGLAKQKKGDVAGGQRDIVAAKSIQRDIDVEFARNMHVSISR